MSSTSINPPLAKRKNQQFKEFGHSRHEYYVQHNGDYFYILTNKDHPSFSLVRTPTHEPQESDWQEIIAGRYQFLRQIAFQYAFVLKVLNQKREYGI